jgi:raffinose/stachyose/melibiose transport system permease protein
MNSLSALKNDNYHSGKTLSVKNQKVRNSLFIILFLLPALILFILFLVYPIFRSVYFSTF